jgi:hypothetical protein
MSKSNTGVLNGVLDTNYRVTNSATTYPRRAPGFHLDLRDASGSSRSRRAATLFPCGRRERPSLSPVGYYMGKLKLEETYTETYDDVDVYYNAGAVRHPEEQGGMWMPYAGPDQ